VAPRLGIGRDTFGTLFNGLVCRFMAVYGPYLNLNGHVLLLNSYLKMLGSPVQVRSEAP